MCSKVVDPVLDEWGDPLPVEPETPLEELEPAPQEEPIPAN